MKRILLITVGVILLGLIAVPILTRFLGPKLIYVAAPKGNAIGEVELPRPEPSRLAVKLTLPLTVLDQIANQKAPQNLTGSETGEIHRRIKNGAYGYNLARGQIRFQHNGEQLGFTVPFDGVGQFQGEIDARILTVPIKTGAEIGGVVGGTLAPAIAPDWTINPNYTPYINLTKANLSLGALGTVDVSELLGSSLGGFIQEEAKKLSPTLRDAINLRGEVEALWQQAHLYEQINDDPAAWLVSKPTGIGISPIDFSLAEQIGLTLAIDSETFLTNKATAAPKPTPLPNLEVLTGPTRTDLRIPLVVSVDELNRVLETETINIEAGLGTELTLSNIEAEIGQNGALNLKVSIQANKSRLGRGVEGEIWLTGKPIIDVDEQTLGFTDIDFTVETRDQLTVAAAWMLEGILIRGIERELRVDLDDYQSEIDEEVEKALADADLPPGIEVSVDSLEVKLADIYTISRRFPDSAKDPGIVLVIRASGDLTTQLSPEILDSDEGP